jgi:hypothetical protein
MPDRKDELESLDNIERMGQDTDALMLASKRLAVELQALTEPLLPSRRIRRDQPVRVPIDMGLSDAEIWAWAEHESLQVSSSRKRPELAAKGN